MIGRGTRLCFDLFGPGKDKQFFQIFDHWGNFEYFDELIKEEEPSQMKSLSETLFAARIQLAEAAISKQDLETLKLATNLIAADINALPSDCLSVKEKWREIKGIQRDGVIAAFQPATVATLKSQMATLMQWKDVRGAEAAHQFDTLITRLQEAKLTGSATASDLQDTVTNQVSELPINLTQVAAKIATIKEATSTTFMESATVADLEHIRTELRGIMRFRKKGTTGTLPPLVINISEDPTAFQSTPHKPKLEGLDLAHYRNRVEGILRSLMEESTALKKIRAGQPVTPDDLEELTSEVLLQDPDLHLEELLIHYPNKAKRMDLAIRQIIGLDATKVDEHFRAFVQKYPALNANQIRFLELLKSYVARFGAIELEKLWEAPFTTIHGSGVDGVFTNSTQVDDLLTLLGQLNEEAA